MLRFGKMTVKSVFFCVVNPFLWVFGFGAVLEDTSVYQSRNQTTCPGEAWIHVSTVGAVPCENFFPLPPHKLAWPSLPALLSIEGGREWGGDCCAQSADMRKKSSGSPSSVLLWLTSQTLGWFLSAERWRVGGGMEGEKERTKHGRWGPQESVQTFPAFLTWSECPPAAGLLASLIFAGWRAHMRSMSESQGSHQPADTPPPLRAERR